MYVEEAWRALASNAVRSALTIVGLIIGVGAVIAIQVLGSAMAGAVDGALGAMTDNSFILFPNARQRDVTRAALHIDDIAALQRDVPGIISAFPLAGTTELVRAGHVQTRFFLSSDGATSLTNLPVVYGRHFTDDDIASGADVAVISNNAYDKLFPGGGDPTGQSIYAGAYRYVVVGVLEAPKRGFINAQFGGDVTIPWTTYVREYLQGGTVGGAVFIVRSPSQIPVVEREVQDRLQMLRRGSRGLQYQTLDKAKISQGIGGIFNALTLIVGLIGAVSLLVAGIGIMNVMLVSVAERTREIGVRKAVGARGGQILWQFFSESLMLSGFGCAVGLGLGLLLGEIVNRVFLVKLTGVVSPLPWPQAVAVAAGFAVIVTLAFGTYPAYRAARLDPIEALRYE
jgi:ABC-type antimicrobial peptide transport system permease subunit